tara:strand:- start:1497 stop:2102 length:606 start_codon:yes stop_codon:yes gene_type:complete
MNKKFKYYILVGFFSILPIGATIWVLKWLLTLLVGPAQSITKILLPSTLLQPYASWVFGFILTITFVFIFGYIVSSFLGKLLFSKIENLIEQIPIANTLYKTIKSVIDSISNSQHNAFQKVVMLEYPRKGIWTLALVTGESENNSGKKFYHLFLPTSPNPTSGYMLYIAAEDVKETDMSSEEAIKIIISGGALSSSKNNID